MAVGAFGRWLDRTRGLWLPIGLAVAAFVALASYLFFIPGLFLVPGIPALLLVSGLELERPLHRSAVADAVIVWTLRTLAALPLLVALAWAVIGLVVSGDQGISIGRAGDETVVRLIVALLTPPILAALVAMPWIVVLRGGRHQPRLLLIVLLVGEVLAVLVWLLDLATTTNPERLMLNLAALIGYGTVPALAVGFVIAYFRILRPARRGRQKEATEEGDPWDRLRH